MTKIQRQAAFLAATVFKDQITFNSYSVTLYIDIITDKHTDQIIAMERLDYMFYEQFNNCFFIGEKCVLTDKLAELNCRICVLPEEPYDQLVSLMLYVKLNSILDGKFYISDLSLEGSANSEISYLVDEETNIGPFNKPGWYTKNSATITTLPKSKIVEISKIIDQEWADIGLGWE